MAFNETVVLRKLQRRIGSKLFQALDPSFFIDILNEETLDTFSSYYPKLVKGVRIDSSCAIPTYDPGTKMIQFHRYKIPKYSNGIEYVGIELALFPNQNYNDILSGYNSLIADSIMSKMRSLMPYPIVSYTAAFEAPDFCLVQPYRTNHTDFSLIMQRKLRLPEITLGLQEYFMRLFTFDCKLAVYNEFPGARDSGVINGIEVNTNISDFNSAAGDREALLETFEADFMSNPERLETIFSQQ
jgi:hypothetical protein